MKPKFRLLRLRTLTFELSKKSQLNCKIGNPNFFQEQWKTQNYKAKFDIYTVKFRYDALVS